MIGTMPFEIIRSTIRFKSVKTPGLLASRFTSGIANCGFCSAVSIVVRFSVLG